MVFSSFLSFSFVCLVGLVWWFFDGVFFVLVWGFFGVVFFVFVCVYFFFDLSLGLIL